MEIFRHKLKNVCVSSALNGAQELKSRNNQSRRYLCNFFHLYRCLKNDFFLYFHVFASSKAVFLNNDINWNKAWLDIEKKVTQSKVHLWNDLKQDYRYLFLPVLCLLSLLCFTLHIFTFKNKNWRYSSDTKCIGILLVEWS